jgi:aryl-alcohol dehydrogenase-like predicted oxidoreductase
MEHRELGGTGLTVSRMGIGLAALGRPAYINLGHAVDLGGNYDVDAMCRATAEVLDAAWDAGVTYVDVARSYGRAEAFLASWLDGRRRDERPVIGSKWGYEYTGGWRLDAGTHEVKEHSLAMFERQWAETDALLGTTLDLYQVHSLTLDSGALDDDDLLDALARLRDAGIAVGASLSGPRQVDVLERVLDVERAGARLFSTVQATWNVLEPSAGAMLRTAHEAGLGVIVKEAVANGRLTPRGTDQVVREVLDPIAARHGVTVDAVALAAVLAQPWVDVVLSGVAAVAHLHANLRAFDVSLAPEDRDALDGLGEHAGTYWDRRGALPWA